MRPIADLQMRYQAIHKHNYKQKLRITHFKLHIHEMCCCFTYISKWLMIWRPQKVAAKMGDFHAISTMQIAFVEFITWVLPHEKCKYILDQHFQYRPGWRTHFSPVTVAVCITATGELDQFTDRLGSFLVTTNYYIWDVGAAFCAFRNTKSAFP